MFLFKGGVQEAVTARIRCGWKKFKDIASVLCRRAVKLTLRRGMHNSCARSALCCGADPGFSEKKMKGSCYLLELECYA